MDQNIENQIDEIISDWSKAGFTHVAVSKNNKCFPINSDMAQPLASGSFRYSPPVVNNTPSIGGDLFYKLDSREARAFLFKSLKQGDSYNNDDNLV